MSTRSYVGIIKNDKIKYGYHHSDSHLESLGIELFQSIKNEADADAKISEFACIESGHEDSREHFFKITGEDISIEFCYGFDVSDNQWYVSSCHFSDATKTFKLNDIVKDDKEMSCYADMYYEKYRKGIIDEIRKGIA